MIKDRKYMQDITDYLKKNLKKGYTKDSLRWALINQGYPRLEVEKALKAVDIRLAEEAPILKTKPEIQHEIIEPKELSTKKSFWKKLFS
ncbi:MAG: hypothetical protein Q7S74_03825 [Nanoarchaeota archaeon]|nr:hypothetical protein [Nanoarchaeota archaeon]